MSEVSTFVETWDTLLKHFCSRDDLRPAMCKPNIVGDYVYATDAHSWLKIPFQPSFRHYGTHEKTPNFESVRPQWKTIDPISISKIAIENVLSKFDKIPDWTECNECNGRGAIECKCCGHESECEMCDGDGTIEDYTLPEVYDNGEDEDMGAIEILDNLVAPFQLGRLLRVLDFIKTDNVLICTNERHKGMVFKSNEIEIVIMPLQQSDKKYSKRIKLEI